MNQNDFIQLINTNALSGAYLLHGEEEFIKESVIRSVVDSIPEDTRAFNYTLLRDAVLSEITDSCETLPMFADKKLVIVRETAGSIDNSALCEYCGRIPAETILLIVKKGVCDERTALVKYFVKAKRDVLFEKPDISTAVRWAMRTAAEQGVKLEQPAARLLIEIVGTDMASVNNELSKAIDRVGPGGAITSEIVSSTVIGNIESKIFAMLSFFTSGKVKEGMQSLRVLLYESREAPLSVISFLESRFKLMLQGKLIMADGLNPKAAAKKMEGSAYANELACRAAVKYSVKDLEKLVSDISIIMFRSINGEADPIKSIENIMISFPWKGRA